MGKPHGAAAGAVMLPVRQAARCSNSGGGSRLPVRSTHKLVSQKPSKAAVDLSVVGNRQTTYFGRAIFANR
jgi:hypothetical protein